MKKVVVFFRIASQATNDDTAIAVIASLRSNPESLIVFGLTTSSLLDPN